MMSEVVKGLLAALVMTAVLGAAIAWQSRVVRRIPELGLRVTWAGALRAMAKGVGTNALVGVLAHLAMPPVMATAVTVVVGLYLAARLSLVVEVWGLDRFVRRLEANDLAGATRLGLQVVRRVRRLGGVDVVARIARTVAATLNVAVDAKSAEQALALVEQVQFSPDTTAWSVTIDLALYRIAMGDLKRAKSLIAQEERRWSPPPSLEDDHELVRARIEAATDEPLRALERAERRDGVQWDCVRAHAHAALGQGAEARKSLQRVREVEHGEEVLRQVAERGGPAAPIARALCAERPDPYR